MGSGRGQARRAQAGAGSFRPGITDVDLGPDPSEFSKRAHCSACGAKFTASHEALEVGAFRGQTSARWYGESGGTTRFYLTCPGCDELVFVEQNEVPLLLQRDLCEKYNEEVRGRNGNELPGFQPIVPTNVPGYPTSSPEGASGDESLDPHKVDF